MTRNSKGQFIKGSIPWIKGKHIRTNTGRTHFKKGHIPWSATVKGLGIKKAWNKGLKGVHFSPKTEFKKGHPCGKRFIKGCSTSPKTEFKKGMVIPPDILEKKRLNFIRNQKTKGPNHWNWQGGTTPKRTKAYFSQEYKTWRKSVLVRDQYQCKFCKAKGNLHTHHIKLYSKYPDKRLDIDNGITLCKTCHKIIHMKYKPIYPHCGTGVLVNL